MKVTTAARPSAKILQESKEMISIDFAEISPLEIMSSMVLGLAGLPEGRMKRVSSSIPIS